MNPFFQSVADANRARCAVLGLSAAELYGTEPNAAEIEVSRLIGLGVPAEAAVPRIVEKYRTGFGGDKVAMTLTRLRIARDCRQRRDKYRSYYPATPFERLARIETRVKGGAV